MSAGGTACLRSLGVVLLAACESERTTAPWECDVRTMGVGEVRVRQVPCSDELIEDGEALRGDWVLENAVARFFVRGSEHALTQRGLAGGTVVDAAPPGGPDTLVELVPEIEGGWLDEVTGFVPSEGSLRVEGRAGGERTQVTYSLSPDSPVLELDVESALVVPLEGAVLTASILERADAGDAWLAGDAVVEDMGGWIRMAGPFAAGTRAVVTSAIHADTLEVSGTSDGQWVVAEVAGAVALRLPVVEGSFTGRVPAGSALHAEALGAEAGARVGADDWAGGALDVGPSASLELRVTKKDGSPIPSLLRLADGRIFAALPGGEPLATGPYVGSAEVFLGPAYERIEIDLAIDGTTRRVLVADPVISNPFLADFGTLGWPDRAVRESASPRLAQVAGWGVDMAVLQARDEVATTALDEVTAAWILAQGGTRTTGHQGSLVAWPMSPTPEQGAHGAADWEGVDAEDLLAALDRGHEHSVLVDRTWVDQVPGFPGEWEPKPFGFRFGSLDDLPAYVTVLDGWLALGAVGPLTWVDDVGGRTIAEAENALLYGRSTATNGPRIRFTLAGGAPGDLVSTQTLPVSYTLVVEAPTWIPLTGASLVGPGGATLATFELSAKGATRLDVTGALGELPAWVLAIAWGDDPNLPWLTKPAFAVTSPVWRLEP